MNSKKKCRKCRLDKYITEFDYDRLGRYGVASTCKLCKKLWQKPQKELKRTPVATVGKKRTERLKNWGSERVAHKKVYEISQNCRNCGKYVPIPFDQELPPVWCFAHILSKKNYPALRLFINNFAFVCSINCHDEIDTKLAGRNKEEIQNEILAGKTIKI